MIDIYLALVSLVVIILASPTTTWYKAGPVNFFPGTILSMGIAWRPKYRMKKYRTAMPGMLCPVLIICKAAIYFAPSCIECTVYNPGIRGYYKHRQIQRMKINKRYMFYYIRVHMILYLQ